MYLPHILQIARKVFTAGVGSVYGRVENPYCIWLVVQHWIYAIELTAVSLPSYYFFVLKCCSAALRLIIFGTNTGQMFLCIKQLFNQLIFTNLKSKEMSYPKKVGTFLCSEQKYRLTIFI